MMAAHKMANACKASMPSAAKILLLIALAVLYFWNLGTGSLRQWDEGLTAERAREIIETGQWLTPQFGYKPDFNKPPLYYWLTALNYRIFGIHEFSVRLWSALFGMACVVLVYCIARQIASSSTTPKAWNESAGGSPRDAGSNPFAGLLAAFFLATNPHWMNRTREGLLDSGMLFGMLACVYLMNRAADRVAWESCPCRPSGAMGELDTPGIHGRDGRAPICSSRPLKTRGLYALAGLCLAIGILIKGPLPFFAFAIPLWDRFLSRTRRHSLSNLAIALGASLICAGPWFLYQYFTHGTDFANRYISRNLFDRLTQTIESHHGSVFFYINQWSALAAVSLLFFTIALIIGAIFHRSRLKSASSIIFLALLLLVFLSAAASKRNLYLLLIYPFASITSGVLLAPWLHSLKTPWQKKGILAVLLVSCLLGFFPGYDRLPDHDRHLKQIGLKIAEVAGPDEPVCSVNIPINNLLFYSRRRVNHMPLEGLGEFFGLREGFRDGNILFVVRNKDFGAFQGQIRLALPRETHEGKIVLKNSKYTLYQINGSISPT